MKRTNKNYTLPLSGKTRDPKARVAEDARRTMKPKRKKPQPAPAPEPEPRPEPLDLEPEGPAADEAGPEAGPEAATPAAPFVPAPRARGEVVPRDPLQLYLREISRFPMLAPDEEF